MSLYDAREHVRTTGACLRGHADESTDTPHVGLRSRSLDYAPAWVATALAAA